MTAISHHNPFHCPIFHKFNPYIFLLYIIRLIYVYFANKSFCVVSMLYVYMCVMMSIHGWLCVFMCLSIGSCRPLGAHGNHNALI